MGQWLNLIEETLSHFQEGAKSVRAYTNNKTYIITPISNTNEFWVATEEPGFPKSKASSLEEYYKDVFGIEAKY
jgi:hypothetical protein